MKKTKQILAIIIILILVGMYVATFILAITDNPSTMSMFWGCVFCTIFIPLAAYVGISLHKYAMTRSKRRDYYSSPASEHDNGTSDDKR